MDYKEKLRSLVFSKSGSPVSRRGEIADYVKTFPDLEKRLAACDQAQWERERRQKYLREEQAELEQGRPTRDFMKIVDDEMRKLKGTL